MIVNLLHARHVWKITCVFGFRCSCVDSWASMPSYVKLQSSSGYRNRPRHRALSSKNVLIGCSIVTKQWGTSDESFSSFGDLWIPGHALHEIGFTEINKHQYSGQQPGKKSASRPVDKPVVNQTFCSFSGRDVQESCFPHARENEEEMSSWRAESSTSLLARPCLAPPPDSAPPCPDMPMVCQGFGTFQVRLHARCLCT